MSDAKKILYVDLDNTMVDFHSGIDRVEEEMLRQYKENYDEIPGIFALMNPMPGAIDSYRQLSEWFDTYILSTAPWLNSSAWADKLEWVQLHLGIEEGTPAWKRLILTHHKNLNKGDYLVDDRTKNGADLFDGELILFGSTNFPDWSSVVDYLGKHR